MSRNVCLRLILDLGDALLTNPSKQHRGSYEDS